MQRRFNKGWLEWGRILLTFMLAGATTSHAAAQATDARSLVDLLRDQTFLDQYREGLSGSVQITLDDEAAFRPSVNFIGTVIGTIAEPCGFRLDLNRDDSADRYVWLAPLSNMSIAEITTKIEHIETVVGAGFGDEKLQLIDMVASQLEEFNIARLEIGVGVPPDPKTLTAMFFEASAIGEEERLVADFIVFSSLAGALTQLTQADLADFPYLSGGANLSQIEGGETMRLVNACRALPIVRRICAGEYNRDVPRDMIQADLDSIKNACLPPSAALQSIIRMDELSKRLN